MNWKAILLLLVLFSYSSLSTRGYIQMGTREKHYSRRSTGTLAEPKQMEAEEETAQGRKEKVWLACY